MEGAMECNFCHQDVADPCKDVHMVHAQPALTTSGARKLQSWASAIKASGTKSSPPIFERIEHIRSETPS
jgi:hypothetical protein